MNTSTSFRLPPYTRRQLAELGAAHGLSASTVVMLALDRMHNQTIGAHAEADPMVAHFQAQEDGGEEEPDE
jgi:hypothetical protein